MSAGPLHLMRLGPCGNLAAAEASLADALEALEPQTGPDWSRAAYLRIEQPIGTDCDLPAWLGRYGALPRVYWGNRGGFFALAGVGIADQVEGPDFSILPPFLRACSTGPGAQNVRVIAWGRFDLRTPPAANWAPFGRVRALLPLIELRRTSSHCVLSVNLKADAVDRPGAFETLAGAAYQALRDGAPGKIKATPTPPLDPHLDPDAENWHAQVEQILEQIDARRMEKVVLARRATHALSVDALDLFTRRLRECPESFHLFLEVHPTTSFLAASPERLYYRDGRQLETEALAGTRARASGEEEDLRRVHDLLTSKKDLHEHEIVSSDIVRRLQPICDGVTLPPPPVVHSVARLHHLRTPISALLKAGVDDAQILSALHPTPAVCGMPTGLALHFLRTTEGFDRGLYGGPVGCFGPRDAEVAVGIRSALVRPDAVQLLAGAGIVAGSDPDAEWQETEDKMRGLRHLLENDEPA